MTEEMQEQLAQWQQDVMNVSKQITAAQIEYKDACTVRLERKHRLEELESHLKNLCDRGPYGGEGSSESLLSTCAVDDPEDSVRILKLPGRIVGMLERAGLTTVSRVGDVIEGYDNEFDNLDAVPDMDPDARNRIQAAYDDVTEEVDTPAIVPASAPVSEVTGDAVPKRQSEKAAIQSRISIPDSQIVEGGTYGAVLTAEGQAIVALDGTEVVLELGEYALA